MFRHTITCRKRIRILQGAERSNISVRRIVPTSFHKWTNEFRDCTIRFFFLDGNDFILCRWYYFLRAFIKRVDRRVRLVLFKLSHRGGRAIGDENAHT